MPHSRSLVLNLVVLVGLYSGELSISACTTPVYEYALLNWPADPYGIFVFHRGDLSREEQAEIEELKRSPAEPVVRLVDVQADLDEPARRLWERQGEVTLPWMVVCRPSPPGRERVAWTGSLNRENVQRVLDSPMRQEIARRILHGDGAVWIFLESGVRDKDDEAARLLESELKRLSKIVRPVYPIATETQAAEAVEATTGEAVHFSMMRLARDNFEEKFLIDLLLDSEPDLRGLAEPMTFPMFGRGRVLYALVGKGIHAGNIHEACTFLVEGCSCIVKAENPGSDLLMAVDWQGLLEGLPVTTTRAAEINRRDLLREVEPLPVTGGGHWWRIGLLGLIVGVAAVGLIGWITLRRVKTH